MDNERLRVGVVSSVHGVHGECKVFPTTDDADRFRKLKKVFINDQEYEISSVKFFKGMVICKFDGVDTPEDVQKLRGRDIMINREDAVPLKEGEHYIADLIGCEVVSDTGESMGVCEDIIPTGANQVMQVKGKKDFLVPYIKQCILGVDLAKRQITIHVLDGLLDL